MMPGMIMLWAGSVATIPSGWHECNGAMGTPDLRNRFVPGAGIFKPQGSIGGSATHNHNFTGDGHRHVLLPGAHLAAGAVKSSETNTVNAVGTTDFGSSDPAYHALVYIMKL